MAPAHREPAKPKTQHAPENAGSALDIITEWRDGDQAPGTISQASREVCGADRPVQCAWVHAMVTRYSRIAVTRMSTELGQDMH